MKRRLFFAALPLVLSACGGGQTRLDIFSAHRAANEPSALAALQSTLAHLPIPEGARVAIGVVDDGIVGTSLTSGATWTFEHPLDSRPVVVGTVVVGMGQGELFALDATSGEPLWTRRATGALRGAGDDGRTTVVSLATKGENATTILVVSHDGRVMRQLEVGPVVGVPAVIGHHAFFPWHDRSVTIYDLTNGDEVVRFALPERTSRAFTIGKALYFGEQHVFRYGEDLAREPARALSITSPPRELPGSPKWQTNGTSVVPLTADARDKVRLYAHPKAVGPLGVEGDTFVGAYFKLAMGFDAKSGATTWVRTMSDELLGGAAFLGGTALCDAAGTVTFLDQQTGEVAGEVSLGRSVKACVVQADGLSRPSMPSRSPLAEQFTSALKAASPELIAMQKELLRELRDIGKDGSFTKALIDILGARETPQALVSDAREALAARRNGTPHMLEALARHYDYLRDELLPPPVGPLADALAAMNELHAAPLLAAHLLDPATSSSDIERVAHALFALATERELPQLRSFFALYRATADDEALVRAAAIVARTIVDIAGPEGRELVERGLHDPTTVPELRERLATMLNGEEMAATSMCREIADDALKP